MNWPMATPCCRRHIRCRRRGGQAWSPKCNEFGRRWAPPITSCYARRVVAVDFLQVVHHHRLRGYRCSCRRARIREIVSLGAWGWRKHGTSSLWCFCCKSKLKHLLTDGFGCVRRCISWCSSSSSRVYMIETLQILQITQIANPTNSMFLEHR